MNDATTSATHSESVEILIERARSLVPALRQRSKQANAGGRLPQETIDDFRRLGLTRCLQPKMFGGFGSDYRVFSRMIRALAQGCGSSAWVCAVHTEHSWVVGQFPESAQHAVWDDDPLAVASASFMVGSTAEPAAGGHRLSGRWGYVSGCDYAQWVLLHAVVKGSGAPEARMFLVPMGEVEVIDDWDVLGLRGTGSKSVAVKNLLVPADRSVGIHELKTGTAPGAAVHADNSLYRTPRNMLALFSLSTVNVGLAERAVAEFVEFTRARQSRGVRVAGLEAMQLMVAEASVQADTAALIGEHTIGRATTLAESRQPITADDVAWSRRNASYSTQLAQSAVRLIFEAAGGSALYAGNPLQEIFRDTMAASAHLSLTWHRAAPPYGQLRLGLPVEFDTL
jgi:alkylation response protein AidB-like acyl-CoA dehydrogenase